MEYGDPINAQTFHLAVRIACQLRSEGKGQVEDVAATAVSRAYCVCVTEGEDAAEHRLSDVHQKLITDVIERVRMLDGRAPAPVDPAPGPA
jgi:hypothetical protein